MGKFQTLCRSAIVICMWNGFSALGTVFHSDGSAASVQRLHDAALNGDTITIPAGTFSWTQGVRITKGITIQGQTTVTGDHTTFHNTPMTSGDQTKLVDNIDRNGSKPYFFDMPLAAGNDNVLCRITGITFTGQGGSGNNGQQAIKFGADNNHNARFRIDHCHFTALHFLNHIAAFGNSYGVEDHCLIDNLPSQQDQHSMRNGTAPYGDLEWSQDFPAGTEKTWFIEDCYINNQAGLNTASGGVDSEWGGRYVVRYCELINVELLNHGTEGDRHRGGRGYEVYNCNYTFQQPGHSLDGNRSGVMIVHDNNFYGNKPGGYGFQTYRMGSTFGQPWTGATGRNPWDSNDPTLYQSGRITNAVYNGGNYQEMSDSSKNWTPNQWVGFTVSDNTSGSLIWVTSNTATTLHGLEFGYGSPEFVVGHGFEIRKVLVALDQPNRGRGDLISGDNPINTTTGTVAWPHQVREPSYSWNNVFVSDGSHINFKGHVGAPIFEGVDYFSDTPKPGYTPYTYPHPLVTH